MKVSTAEPVFLERGTRDIVIATPVQKWVDRDGTTSLVTVDVGRDEMVVIAVDPSDGACVWAPYVTTDELVAGGWQNVGAAEVRSDGELGDCVLTGSSRGA